MILESIIWQFYFLTLRTFLPRGFFTFLVAVAHGVPWHPQILADQLTLSQPGGTDYAQQITTGTPGLSDLPTALEGA